MDRAKIEQRLFELQLLIKESELTEQLHKERQAAANARTAELMAGATERQIDTLGLPTFKLDGTGS